MLYELIEKYIDALDLNDIETAHEILHHIEWLGIDKLTFDIMCDFVRKDRETC